MAGETTLTVVGNLTADPTLSFLASGAAVSNFSVASTPRIFDRNSNEWKDGDPLFLRCSVWREQAENVAESLTRGMRVIVTGKLKQRQFQTREGEKRTVIELDVDEIAPSLKYATAKVTRRTQGQAANSGDSRGFGSSDNRGAGQDDPWGSAPPSSSGAFDSEPPFAHRTPWIDADLARG